MKQIELPNDTFAIVDDDMFDYLNQWAWHFGGNYVRFSKLGRKVYMHRLITKAPKGFEVDHINGNTLDNRRENLRICSHAENGRNRVLKSINNKSGYKGVSWRKRDKLWQARITFNKKKIWIGNFKTPEAAALAYDKKAKELHGIFAKVNFS